MKFDLHTETTEDGFINFYMSINGKKSEACYPLYCLTNEEHLIVNVVAGLIAVMVRDILGSLTAKVPPEEIENERK